MTGRHDDNNSGAMTEAELVRQLGELPRRIQPQNDPWPQIRARISAGDAKRSRAGMPLLRLAAAVAVAFAMGLFLGQYWQEGSAGPAPGPQTVQESGGSEDVPNLSGALVGTDRVYQAAFSEYIDVGNSLQVLKPATLDAIERDWQEMLDAEAALSAALEQYPNNPWLNKRMLELRDRQLKMLKQLAGLDRTSRRTEI